jgi:THO complex subunit 3
VLSPTQPTPLSSHQEPVQTNQISFCWGGKNVFASTGDGEVRMLSYPDFTPALRYDYDRASIDGPGSSNEYMMKGHTSSCLSVELSPNARYLASGGTDSVICLWDTQDWICQRTFTDMVGPVKSLSTLSCLHTSLPYCPVPYSFFPPFLMDIGC